MYEATRIAIKLLIAKYEKSLIQYEEYIENLDAEGESSSCYYHTTKMITRMIRDLKAFADLMYKLNVLSGEEYGE